MLLLLRVCYPILRQSISLMFKQMSPNLVILSKMYQVNNGMSLLFTKLDVSMHSKHILAGTFCIIVLTNLRWWQTRTHFCGHKCFPVCPCAATFVANTKFVSEKKNVSDFVRTFCVRSKCFRVCEAWTKNKCFVSRSFAHPRNVISNNVSATMCPRLPPPLLYCHLGICSLPPMQQIFSYKS